MSRRGVEPTNSNSNSSFGRSAKTRIITHLSRQLGHGRCNCN